MNRWRSFALAVLVGSSTLQASQPSSMFSMKEIEAGVAELYNLETDIHFNEYDKAAFRESLAELVALLSPVQFNDLSGHLIADYMHHPEHRNVLDPFFVSLHYQIQQDLRRCNEIHPLMTVIDDVFTAWTAVYVFGFGKGLWKSRGAGLKNLESFKKIVTSIGENMPKGRRISLGITGAGAGIGVAHAIYQTLETKKLDPMIRVRKIREARVQEIDNHVQAALEKTRMKSDWKAEEFDMLNRELQGYMEELAYFESKEVAPELVGAIRPIRLDLSTLSTRLRQIREHISVF